MKRYQRTTRRQRHARYARARKERIHTGLGHVYNTLRFLNLAWLTRYVMLRPWHVADVYLDGKLHDQLYMYPNESAEERLKRILKSIRQHTKKVIGEKPQHGRP